jgi:hypothetical protein
MAVQAGAMSLVRCAVLNIEIEIGSCRLVFFRFRSKQRKTDFAFEKTIPDPTQRVFTTN